MSCWDEPADGYDFVTGAAYIIAAIETVWHERYTLVSHYIDIWTLYAIAVVFPVRMNALL